MQFKRNDTILAPASGITQAAIGVLRLSGPEAFRIAEQHFFDRNMQKKSLAKARSHSLLFGLIADKNQIIDEVLLSVFRNPHSYTGEDVIEISYHGSVYIQQQLLQLFTASGARMAEPGEFTMRAFLNGRMDLSQAEAVADLVSSHSASSHKIAMQQMRGGFSRKIAELRTRLLNFASLIELELDFSEEDVEFADRSQLQKLVSEILKSLQQLLQSFELGNVLKNGVPVTIAGRPNAGKSTLLNVLLQDDRAIVSDIPGTTRDTIEDEMIIDGVLFRFIDTAGLRHTTDAIEKIGVERARETIKRAAIVIYLFDASATSGQELEKELSEIRTELGSAKLLLVGNKVDAASQAALNAAFDKWHVLFISAREQLNVDQLRKSLLQMVDTSALAESDTIVTSARHAAALRNAATAMQKVGQGLSAGIAGDLLALDIRYALQELGNITGEVTNEDLLTNIFTKFCIGK